MPPTDQVLIEARDLERVYRTGDTVVYALRAISLEVWAGEYVSLMGPSGSGKTTLFNVVGGLAKPTAGSVFINVLEHARGEP
ncbi:MAG: ATP-binding cassette domain-containing protein [Phycisphaerae bacterium]